MVYVASALQKPEEVVQICNILHLLFIACVLLFHMAWLELGGRY